MRGTAVLGLRQAPEVRGTAVPVDTWGMTWLWNAIRLTGSYSYVVHFHTVMPGVAAQLKHELVLLVHGISAGVNVHPIIRLV